MQLKPILLGLTTLLTTLTAANPSSQQSSPRSSSSTTLTLHIPSAPILPNPATLPSSTRATLSSPGKSLAAPLSAANTFVFRNVSAGSYLLDVHSPIHVFMPYRVDVGLKTGNDKGVEVWETFRGGDWGNKGPVVTVVGVGEEGGNVVVEGRVVGEKGYFLERSSFSVMSIFKNPIILLSMVSMALFFGMPKLVENMDPEMRAEWEERQKENPMNSIMGAASGQNANPMGNFDMAAFLAGSSSKSEEGKGKGNGENKKKR